MLKNVYNRIYEKGMTFLASIRWEWIVRLYKKPSYMTINDENAIKRMLFKNYYIIATFDPYSLSGLFVVCATFLLTGKLPKYTHVLFNVEMDNEHDENGVPKFRFVESTSDGVHYSDFKKALGHSKRIALITPKYYSQERFDETIGMVHAYIGRGYDFRYNLEDNLTLSCVELVWQRLKQMEFAEDHFRCLSFLMKYEGNLTPEMFFCPDFKIAKQWEFGK